MEENEPIEDARATLFPALKSVIANLQFRGAFQGGLLILQVHEGNRLVGQGAPALWAYIESLLDRAVEKGLLRRSSQ